MSHVRRLEEQFIPSALQRDYEKTTGAMPDGSPMTYYFGLGYDVSFKEYRSFQIMSVSSHLWKYTGKLSATASGGKLIGDSTSSPYPSSRTLAVSGSEVLCFQVSLAITYDNTYKSATTTATLTFNAEQTLHNP